MHDVVKVARDCGASQESGGMAACVCGLNRTSCNTCVLGLPILPPHLSHTLKTGQGALGLPLNHATQFVDNMATSQAVLGAQCSAQAGRQAAGVAAKAFPKALGSRTGSLSGFKSSPAPVEVGGGRLHGRHHLRAWFKGGCRAGEPARWASTTQSGRRRRAHACRPPASTMPPP